MLMQNSFQKDHWNDHAKQWSRIASPLRPSHEDTEIIQQALEPGDGNYLLLGVTPEFASLPGSLVAIDHNAAMIRAVWPGNHSGRNAIQGDWLHLPFGEGAFDAVIGDGCLTLLSFPLQYEQLFSQLRGVLKSRGKVLVRVFASPDKAESCADVCREAINGKAGNFHAFKWRLAMAMTAESGEPNISVAEIHKLFNRLLPDREQLAKASGWDQKDIATIDVYHESSATYSFPTLSRLRQIFPRGLHETGLAHGSYELAERCPTLVLESCK